MGQVRQPKIFRVQIDPMPPPRVTRYSKFSLRAKKYYRWRNDVQWQLSMQGFPFDDCEVFRLRFLIAFPPSYTKAQRKRLAGLPHKLRPDIDNLEKAAIDAVYSTPNMPDDGVVWKTASEKYWTAERIGAIIYELPA